MRKLESYPLKDLVSAFCKQWNLPLHKVDTTFEVKSSKVECATPCVVMVKEKAKNKYYILFKNNLCKTGYHYEVLSKKKMIDPESHFEYFKLKQLEDKYYEKEGAA